MKRRILILVAALCGSTLAQVESYPLTKDETARLLPLRAEVVRADKALEDAKKASESAHNYYGRASDQIIAAHGLKGTSYSSLNGWYRCPNGGADYFCGWGGTAQEDHGNYWDITSDMKTIVRVQR